MNILPDRRPYYVGVDVWETIQAAGQELGHSVLHVIEQNVAGTRARRETDAVVFELKDGAHPMDVIKNFGDSDEMERIIGSNWLEILIARSPPVVYGVVYGIEEHS
jgi:hypothetical protein